jgi:RNA 3'-terminal phosphate cyclase (ATP)
MPMQIDGSQGEGGGQVLRSALSLSLLTGKDFIITNIRARRTKPGLRPQHLLSVEVAKIVGKADVVGDSLGSTSIKFAPKGIYPGRIKLDIGTAGSTTLVIQTIFLPLILAKDASLVTITGGTHVPWSPSFEYLTLHWLQFLQKIGIDIQLTLDKAGFYPKGGGCIQANIHPAGDLKPLDLFERGQLLQIRGISAVANLDRSIAERQRNRVIRRLGDKYYLNDIRIKNLASRFKGTYLLIIAEFEKTQACYFSLGEPGKPAEQVADEAVDKLEEFLSTDGAIDQYLADQLLQPLALANGVSRLRTSRVTRHLVTNANIITLFLPVKITIEGELGEPGLILIDPS